MHPQRSLFSVTLPEMQTMLNAMHARQFAPILDKNGVKIPAQTQSEPEPKFDPLESVRESTKMLQRDIILKLQKRLGEMVDSGADIDDIHSCSFALGVNLEINEKIEDIF